MRKFIFYVVFILVYFLGGLVYILGVPYRMNLVSLLVIPLLFSCWVKWGKVLSAYYGLLFIVLVSKLINETPALSMVLFLRSVLFSMLIYALVKIYVDHKNGIPVFRLCMIISVIQLPVILLEQFWLYNKLPVSILAEVSYTDFDFGTFNFKGDPTLSFFLLLVIIFLLFDKKRELVVPERYRYPIVIWLSITIMVVNSSMARLVLVAVLIVYIIKRIGVGIVMRLGAMVLVSTVVILLIGLPGVLREDIQLLLSNEMSTDARSRLFYYSSRYPAAGVFIMTRAANLWVGLTNNLTSSYEEQYLSGQGYRGGAFSYFFSQKVSLIGDGPGIYYDVLEQVKYRGNSGHFFTYYSETGLFGLLISYLVFFLVVLEVKPRPGLPLWLYLGSVLAMSLTVDVLNNISIFLAFCIFVLGSQYLLPAESSGQSPA